MLIIAIPRSRPRLPIQRMAVPLKVIEALAPAVVDTMAEPPLHPKVASARVHAPLNVTEGLVSSTRLGSVCNDRSEEHTSELQSQFHLVCRLLLEKKKTTKH